MPRRLNQAVACTLCAAIAALASAARAIETTYGEDPVPNSQCYDGFIDLGYGIDPIPAKSLSVRWQEWRAVRGLPPTVGLFKRQVGESRLREPEPSPVGSSVSTPLESRNRRDQAAQLPSSRRNARTQNLPSRSSVR